MGVLMTTYSHIGKPVTRIEGPAKVAGEALYPADLRVPGALWAKAARSPLPHARIVRVDTSRAARLPGVRAVLTAADVSPALMGVRLRDMPILAGDRVRFIGEKVAVVAAEDPDTAEEAVHLIDVEYEELPAVFDPLEALKPDAPILHRDLASYAGLPQPVDGPTNLFSRLTYAKGDLAEGFAQADHVFEHHFSLQMVHQAYMEPHACLVDIDDQGRVQVWVNNKTPHPLRRQLAEAWGMQPEQVRINVTEIGGDFGGKGSFKDVPVVYYLAKATGRPVRMLMSSTEEFLAGNPRHPGVITIRSGMKKDGTLVARQAHAVFNSGAYGAFKPVPAVNMPGVSHLGGSYRVDHMLVEADCVYTNTVPCGYFRAPGGPQAVFAAECHMDMIAQEMGLDPLELRLKNVLREGDTSPRGRRWREVKGEETIRAAAEAANWTGPKPGPRYGRGMAVHNHSTGEGDSSAIIAVDETGAVTLYSPTFDTGTGIHTVLRQLVAEELTLPLEAVHVVAADTDVTPFDIGIGASRVTHVAGVAAYRAAGEVRQRLAAVAAALLERPEQEIVLRDGGFAAEGAPEPSVSFAEAAALAVQAGGPLRVQAEFRSENAVDVTSFCVQVAEVEVDPETGQVRVHRFVNAVDSGTVLNPIGHRGQVCGGIVQGLGYALSEEMPVEEGRVAALHFGDYKIPTARDIPELVEVVLESASGPIPYQGKSIGETTNCPTAAAVANAVADAVGVRINDLPITAEKVLAALKAQRG